MTYKQFEDVPVWQAAIKLAVDIFDTTDNPVFRTKGDIANQIQRAGLSISNNIAEGFERGTTAEELTFLYYARGSAGEVRSICHVMLRMKSLADYKSQIADMLNQAKAISRQLGGWIRSLKESEAEMPGQRRFTEQARTAREQKASRDQFTEKIKALAAENIRKSKEKPNPEHS